jgi:glycerate dehydrogenase
MDNVVVTFPVDEEAISSIKKILPGSVFIGGLSKNERVDAIKDASILFAWNIKRELSQDEIRLLSGIKFMQLLSAGADHIPFSSIPENVIVASNAGAYADAMAEHVLGMILALSKNLLIEHMKLKNLEFDHTVTGRYIKGSVCGILGFGGIGKAVARLIRPFGAKIYAINTSGKTNERVDFIGTLKDMATLLKESDILVIALPLSKHTSAIIGEKELKSMKSDAILVNVARGDIIDEKSFYEHLKNNQSFKAGIDAWWIEPFRSGEFRMNYPFLDLPNVIGSPHNSALVKEALAEALQYAARNISDFIEGKPVNGLIKRSDYA